MAQNNPSEWSRIDAGPLRDTPYTPTAVDPGGVEDAGADIIDANPPVEDTSPIILHYPQLDPGTPENKVRGISAFTKLAYSLLPEFMREADEQQNPESGGWPLLRLFDAWGHIGDRAREVTAELYSGTWTDPETVPDRGLLWLASLLGVPASQKNVPPAQLREALGNMIANGRPPVGTRSQIAAATRQFLTGTKQALVTPLTRQAPEPTPEDIALTQAMGLPGTPRVWVSPGPPMGGKTYRWDGTPNASPSSAYTAGTRTGINIIPNSSFESESTAFWSATAMTLAVGPSGTGADGGTSRALQATTTGAADGRVFTTPLPGAGGRSWTMSARVKATTTITIAPDIFNYSNTTGAGSNVVNLPYLTNTTTLIPGAWTDITVTVDMPPAVASLRAVIRTIDTTGKPAATIEVDHVVLAPTDLYLGHFNGDTPDERAQDVWIDTAGPTVKVWNGQWVTSPKTGLAALTAAAITAREADRVKRAHTIAIIVRPDEVPDGNLNGLAESVRSVGIIPAGHDVLIIPGTSTWGGFEAAVTAAGNSWKDYEAITRTWADVESLGLEAPEE